MMKTGQKIKYFYNGFWMNAKILRIDYARDSYDVLIIRHCGNLKLRNVSEWNISTK